MTSSPLIERLEGWQGEMPDALKADLTEAAALIRELVEALETVRKLAMDDHWGTPKVCWEIIQTIDTARIRAKATSND